MEEAGRSGKTGFDVLAADEDRRGSVHAESPGAGLIIHEFQPDAPGIESESSKRFRGLTGRRLSAGSTGRMKDEYLGLHPDSSPLRRSSGGSQLAQAQAPRSLDTYTVGRTSLTCGRR